MYNVNLSIGDFHLVFSSIQDKVLANEKVIKGLVTYDVYDEIISDQEKYDRLIQENIKLNALNDRLYKETDKQLKARNGDNQ
jgi:hypothetical protein